MVNAARRRHPWFHRRTHPWCGPVLFLNITEFKARNLADAPRSGRIKSCPAAGYRQPARHRDNGLQFQNQRIAVWVIGCLSVLDLPPCAQYEIFHIDAVEARRVIPRSKTQRQLTGFQCFPESYTDNR